ncbi:MAG TPA: S4 domain-containing protein, partial [Thermoanaerobaculia bacterium]|nr:S4 domain-containing protein [Thermoanaerobaculia bacterium]
MTLRVLEVPAGGGGRRLDQTLAALVPDHSRSFLARLIDEGAVRVEGVTIDRRSHLVDEGAPIEVEIPEPQPVAVRSQEIAIEILHQDQDLAVIDKPAGLVVHPSAGHAEGTLVNALLYHLEDLSGIG